LCSERSKHRKTEVIQTHISKSKLTYATSMALRSLGEEDASKLLNESTNTTPTKINTNIYYCILYVLILIINNLQCSLFQIVILNLNK